MYIKKAVIDRIEGDSAFVALEDGQTLVWEIGNLPPGIKEGDQVVVEIKDQNKANYEQQALAREILDEIFNNVPQKQVKAE